MIRAHVTRRIDCRGRVNPVSIYYGASEAEIVFEVNVSRRHSEKIAPGYMPVQKAEFFDDAGFRADPLNAKPFLTLTAADLDGFDVSAHVAALRAVRLEIAREYLAKRAARAADRGIQLALI